MTKYIFRLAILFIVLNLIPLFWLKNLDFNIALFTTEYYKFLYNIFIVGLIALYFKNQTDTIINKFENKKRGIEITKAIDHFTKGLQTKDILLIKTSWNTIYVNKNDSNLNVKFDLINRLIENTSEINIDHRLNSKEFQNLIKNIK